MVFVFVDKTHGLPLYQVVHGKKVPFMTKAGKGTTENIFGEIVKTFHGVISESQEKFFISVLWQLLMIYHGL